MTNVTLGHHPTIGVIPALTFALTCRIDPAY